MDTNQVIMRIRLADYGWTKATWHFIAERDPYSFIHPDLDAQLASASSCDDPVMVRADWFVFACAQPPMYENILYRDFIPGMFETQQGSDTLLEHYLGVDVLGDLHRSLTNGPSLRATLLGITNATNNAFPVLRAGFKESGVSLANRLIERHAMADGRGYWKSYDFNQIRAEILGNLFLRPLGPVGAGLTEKHAFQQNGGEIIFNLPNGLQAYLLANADGKLLSRAPADPIIVRDPDNNLESDGSILNGISCMKCHADGMKRPPNAKDGTAHDEIQPSVQPFLAEYTDAEKRALHNLYADDNRLNSALNNDAARFHEAIQRCGAAGFAVEPVSSLYNRFKENITGAALLSELDIDPAQVRMPVGEILAMSQYDLVRSHAFQVDHGGFHRSEFIPLFQDINQELGSHRLRGFITNAYAEFFRADITNPTTPEDHISKELAAELTMTETDLNESLSFFQNELRHWKEVANKAEPTPFFLETWNRRLTEADARCTAFQEAAHKARFDPNWKTSPERAQAAKVLDKWKKVARAWNNDSDAKILMDDYQVGRIPSPGVVDENGRPLEGRTGRTVDDL